MSDLEEAREIFIKDRYATVTTGIEIEDVKDKYARCSLKIDERHKNAIERVMGGAIYTLADFTFAVATNFRQPPTVTVVSQISFLSAAKSDVLYAESRLLKDGRRNCFYEIEIKDSVGTLVAVVSMSGTHL